MSKNVRTNEDQLIESVCKFYLDNKIACDLNYSNAESINIGKIYEDIEDMNIIDSLLVQTAFVVITANKYEKNVLHYNIFEFYGVKIKKFPIDLFPQRESKHETYAYCFKWQEHIVLHIEAQNTGSYTVGGSADIVRYVLESKRILPRGIISLGICFGANERKYHLGDVVISKKVYPYFIGSKIQEKGYFVSDDNVFSVDSSMSAKIKFIIDKNAFSELENTVYFGNYITGEAVVSRRKARDEFVQQTKQTIIAGEMEGYGLFKECKGTYYSIPCLIIKSICDWAVMKNFEGKEKEILSRLCNDKVITSDEEQESIKDRIQAYSAFQAFRVLDILLYNKIFGESIFINSISYIEKFRGHAIYASQIKEKIQELANKDIGRIQVKDKFVIAVLKELINRKFIICDTDTEFDEIINGDAVKIGNWLFSIKRGN